MKIAPKHPKEAERIAALKSYEVLDTTPEQDFDDITQMAAAICGTPIALVSLVDEARQWFKSRHGLDATETHRDLAFCAHAILDTKVFIVENATEDDRFADNPLVAGELGIRFYAGAPLIDNEGNSLGSLCVIDKTPKKLSAQQEQALIALARQTVAQLTLKREMNRKKIEADFFKSFSENAPILISSFSHTGNCEYANRTTQIFLGKNYAGKPIRSWLKAVHPEDRHTVLRAFSSNREQSKANPSPIHVEARIKRQDGMYQWFSGAAVPKFSTSGEISNWMVALNDVSERKSVESKLWENRNFLNTVLESLPVGIVCKDVSKNYESVLWNKTAEKIYGHLQEQAINRTDYDLFPRETADLMRQADLTVVESGKVLDSGEEKVPSPNGESHWLHTRHIPICDDEQKVKYVLSIVEDITDRKERENLLNEEKAKLDLIAANIGDAIWMTDVSKKNMLFLSKGFEKTWEFPREQAIENPDRIYDCIVPQDRERVRAAILFQSRGDFDEIYRIQMPDGKIKWIRDRAFPIKNADGSVSKIVGIASDITESRRQEQIIREQKEKFESIVQNVPVFLSILDKSGELEWINAEWVKVLGWKVEDVKNQDLLKKLFPSEDTQRAFREAMIAADGNWKDFNVHTKTGKPTATIWSTVRLSNGKFICIGNDVSVRKAQEELIRRQQMEIISSAKMSSLGEMASGVAHEINNPLAIIHGLTTQLTRNLRSGKNDPEGLERSLEKIKSTTDRIASIVKGLRAFSRSSDSDPFVDVRASQVISDTLEFCRERFKANDVQLNVDSPSQSLISCRPAQISQIVLNLLNNAYDAVVGRAGAEVKVLFSELDGRTQIRVEDNGPGIPSDIADRIMEPFFTTKDVGKGTGLGLSIAQGLAQEHGGKLYLDRKNPKTCFVLELPISGSKTEKTAA